MHGAQGAAQGEKGSYPGNGGLTSLASDLLSFRTEPSSFGASFLLLPPSVPPSASVLEPSCPASAGASGVSFALALAGGLPLGSTPLMGIPGSLSSSFSFPRSQALAPLPCCPGPSAALRLLSASWLKSLPGVGGPAASESGEAPFSSGWLVLGDSWAAEDHVRQVGVKS